MTTTYNTPGHVCPETGRLSMTVAEAYAREDSADRTFWLYVNEDAESGMDPWRAIDGIDAADVKPSIYSIEWADGKSSDVMPDHVVYMQRTKAEREALSEATDNSSDAAASVREAAAIMGSQRALAEALDVTPPTVNEWCKGDKPVPPAKAPLIEGLTAGRVTCEQVCPKVPWHLVRGTAAPASPDVRAIVREFLAAQQALDAAQARRPPVPAELMRAAERYAPAHRALAALDISAA